MDYGRLYKVRGGLRPDPWKESHTLPISYSDNLSSSCLAQYRDSTSKKRQGNSRQRWLDGRVGDLIKRQDCVQLAGRRCLLGAVVVKSSLDDLHMSNTHPSMQNFRPLFGQSPVE